MDWSANTDRGSRALAVLPVAWSQLGRGRLSATLLLLLATLALPGCRESQSEEPPAEAQLTDDQLRDELDAVIDYTYHNRHLNTTDHAAWQVLHGIVAFKRDFQIRHEGELVGALDYLFAGGEMTGWRLQPGHLNPTTDRRGLRAILEEGSKTGQGHPDQWLGYMSGCNLPVDQTIVVEGQQYTLEDLLYQTEQDAYRNPMREYSWTLMGLTLYRPSDYQWTAADGSQWSIPDLVQIETEHDLNESACGGSHRLVGLTLALNRHLAAGGKLEGPWEAAHKKIQQAIATVKRYQNPNGSFSSNYFIRPSSTPDISAELSTTGHTLEFLALAMTDEELREPWVRRAVERLCKLYRVTEDLSLECGGLYHATSGLIIYRERIFGPRELPAPPAGETSAFPGTAGT